MSVEDSQSVYVLDQEQFDFYKSQGTKWRNLAIASVLLAFIAVGALLVDRYFDQQRDSRLETLAEENHQSLEILERATGPEASQAQKDTLDKFLVAVDCSNRTAIQELADELVKQGLIKPVNVVCEEGN